MQSLPKELLDAGRIDGCTEYGISVKIMMPITKPAFASMAILCAMGSWNNMLWPMLVFRDTSKFTLQIGLNTLLTPYGNNYNLLIAGSMFWYPSDPDHLSGLPEISDRWYDIRCCQRLIIYKNGGFKTLWRNRQKW